jgi:hypothetical protein
MNKSGVDGRHLEQADSTMAGTSGARTAEMQELERTMELLRDGGYGYLPEQKQSGNVRILMEDFNSLGILTQSWKVDKLNAMIKSLNIDILCGCETQVDWRLVPPEKQFLKVIQPGIETKGVAACNTTSRVKTRDQVGGVAAVAIG